MIRASLILFGLCAVACGGGGPSVVTDGYDVGAVSVTLRVEPARAQVGQTVVVRLRMVNNAGQATELRFPTGQRYDYWVTGPDGESWRWSDGMVFTQSVVAETLDAQSSVSFPESWTPVGSGTFIVHAQITADGYTRQLTGQVVVT